MSIVESYDKLGKIIFSPKYWKFLKMRAEFIFLLSKELVELPKDGIPVIKIFEYKHKQWASRLLFGVAAELVLKAAYLKKGFIVNKITKDLPDSLKDKKFPYKYKDFNTKKFDSERYKKEVEEYKHNYEFRKEFYKNLKKMNCHDSHDEIDKSHIKFLKKSCEEYLYLTERMENFRKLIDHVEKIFPKNCDLNFEEDVKLGLHIVRTWRNKYSHSGLDPHNYLRDEMVWINNSLKNIYKYVFNEDFEGGNPYKTLEKC